MRVATMKTRLLHSNSNPSLTSVPSRPNKSGSSPDGEDTSKWESESRNNCCQKAFRRKNIERLLPIMKWLPEYNVKKAFADLIAGVTVGSTVLPQALAYATVAGLPPIYGLYSSFVGCFVYIFFGSTKEITIGPTAIQSVLTHKYTVGKPPEYAIFLAAVTGIVTLFMGIFRLGFIANFISRPVISGFTSGVSITILASQTTQLFGWELEAEQFLPFLKGIIIDQKEINHYDAILGGVCIVVLLVLQNLPFLLTPVLQGRPHLDKAVWFFSAVRSCMVIIGSSIACYVIDPSDPADRLFTLIDTGNLTSSNSGLPIPKLPPTSIFDPSTNSTHSFAQILKEEASAMIVLPLLGVLGHITIAKAFAGTDRVDSSQEILCIGITNSISCFLSSYPVGGSFSRSTVNAFSGVESPMGGLYTGIMILLSIQFLTQYFYFIPKASLAAVIICSVIFMIDWDIILPLWRSKRTDLIPLSVTFLVTVLVGLDLGILTGLIISTLNLLYNAARPRFKVLEAETRYVKNKFILIVLDRSLTFPSADYITYEINKSVVRFGSKNIPAAIDCHHIQYTDFTAAEAMKSLLETLADEGYHLIFYRLNRSMLQIVKGVMYDAATHFVHCETEEDLETLIDGSLTHVRTTEESGIGKSIAAAFRSLSKTDREPRMTRRGSRFE